MEQTTQVLPPRYTGAELVARGGMGDIFRARDTSLGRDVAIKVLAERFAQDAGIRDRFTREALAAARLSGDPNTVTIFDVGEWEGRPFIVMEYLAGGSLEDVVRGHGKQPPGRALAWLEDTARALDAAHASGVVHRDVKPANLLLNRDGEVYVADFGIASAAGLDSFTHPGTVLGTAGYLSPEQARGERATPASDRYALGVVGWELLTGQRPFAADSPTAEASAHVHAPVPSISTVEPSLPPQLDDCFRRALAKDPEQRFASCTDFVAAIRSTLEEAAGATRVIPAVAGVVPAPPTRPGRRRAIWPFALAGLVAAGLAGVALAAVLGDENEARPQPSTIVRVRTVETTLPGTTQEVEVPVTVTQTVPAESPPDEEDGEEGEDGEAQPPPQGGSIEDAIALNDQATALIRAGRYGEALPLAQQALQIAQGTGHEYEAYANYNVGRSLAELGRCSEARPYLERREAMLGSHPDVTAAKRKCGF